MSELKLSTNEVRAMMDEITKTYEAGVALTARIRALCPHEVYVEGITMTGCIQRCMLCQACGEMKPWERSHDEQGHDYTIQFGG